MQECYSVQILSQIYVVDFDEIAQSVLLVCYGVKTRAMLSASYLELYE